MTDPPLRLLIADDEPLIREGLTALLDAEPDLLVVASAADGREAVGLATSHRIDVVLMDIRMPVLDGIEATRRIRALPGTPPRVLVLTTFSDDDFLLGALRAGAHGFVLKRSSPADIAGAIRTVAHGDSLVLPATVRSRLVPEKDDRHELRARRLAQLTSRETQVLALLAEGRSNAEIAGDLFVSFQTVKTHVGSILAKLDARDRTQAAVIAHETRPGPASRGR
ncbi:response regulator [Arthrobacter sp. L77]|uniref:response regulator n=1 Tax=Arthrobacter sp. L77 TaxID=1496689 RepID=UPI0005B772CA|nr:response regulator transcription factor [Arthrobacter sp. L77]